MRVVNVYKYERKQGDVRYSKVLDGQAKFHQWGVDYEEFDDGQGNFSTAIIERSDGTIETPRADMVEFIDSE